MLHRAFLTKPLLGATSGAFATTAAVAAYSSSLRLPLSAIATKPVAMRAQTHSKLYNVSTPHANALLMTPSRSASTVAISVQGLHYVGTGLAAIALAGVGMGIGTIFGCLLLGCARNPAMSKMLFNYAILGFALTEAIGLFALMLSFLMLFS